MKICAVFCVFVALALGSPVPPNTQQCECSAAARSLLSSLSHIMQKMIPHTLTASVCQPSGSAHNVSCSSHRRSSFSETECLRNIRADLSYYDVMLSSYRPSETDLSPVKTATKGLMNCLNENCEAADGEFPQWRVWSGSSFDDRLSLCKTLKGFHIRAITVNRALGYIGSGEHRK
ncbi:interleukin-12 subunit alpha-like [Sinocyclocheilus rhinocerous]|uniref:interleukin-12 subunit alpha-like n=1 Tax=Sinocyclocheilus rhinocerous TaxID=307959 RepID=UPI0007BAAB07|nr:PREDICTED: interleukin-12 subunit alpha-like [Sinocyclocheilus rhinocerous]